MLDQGRLLCHVLHKCRKTLSQYGYNFRRMGRKLKDIMFFRDFTGIAGELEAVLLFNGLQYIFFSGFEGVST